MLAVAAIVRLWGVSSPARPVRGRAVLRVRCRGLSWGGGVAAPFGATPRRPDRRRTDLGPPAVGQVDHRAPRASARSASARSAGGSRRRCSASPASALLYLLALRLWRSIWWAGLASLLLALDGLHIVQSRIAMLDIFLTTFITAGPAVLGPRSGTDGRSPDTPTAGRGPIGCWLPPTASGRASRSAAAIATKWSGVFALSSPLRSARSGVHERRRGDRGATAIARHALDVVAVVPFSCISRELRIVLLPARTRDPRFVELQVHMLRASSTISHPTGELAGVDLAPDAVPDPLLPHASASSGVGEIVALGNPGRCGGGSCCCSRSGSSGWTAADLARRP